MDNSYLFWKIWLVWKHELNAISNFIEWIEKHFIKLHVNFSVGVRFNLNIFDALNNQGKSN